MKIFPIIMLFVIAGCVAPSLNENNMSKDVEINTIIEGLNYTNETIQAANNISNNNYYRYDPELYQAALNDNKIVFLYFRANWCPICNAERPHIQSGFDSIGYTDVVGFEVHYNDDETKQFDNELIKKFQVPYQHTKIILDRNGNVLLKTLDVFSKERVVLEIEKARLL